LNSHKNYFLPCLADSAGLVRYGTNIGQYCQENLLAWFIKDIRTPTLRRNTPSTDYAEFWLVLDVLSGSYNGDNHESKPLGKRRRGQRGELRFLGILMVLSAMGLRSETRSTTG